MDQMAFMDVLPFESLVAIAAFWIIVIFILIFIIHRLNRMKSARVARNTPATDPRRIIQIYYIENVDDSQVQGSSGPASNILNKILSRVDVVDEHPPSYEEVTAPGNAAATGSNSNSAEGDNDNETERPLEQNENNCNLSETIPVITNSNSDQRRGSSSVSGSPAEESRDVVIVVERTLP